MRIEPISSITPIAQASFSSARSLAAFNATQASTSAPSVTSAPASNTQAPATQPSSAPAPAARPSAHAGGAASQSSSASAAEQTLAAVYSATIGGRTYSFSVEESNGEYTASVANLPGASASGSSIEAAENDLGTVIDTLA
jgi:hypothetical protein